MKVKVYFCKKCGYVHRVDNLLNLCPRCWHHMSEQEWEEEDYIDYCNKFFFPFGGYIN